MKPKWFITVSLFLAALLLLPEVVLSAEKAKKDFGASFIASCTGKAYRAKKNGVPVYDEPKKTAAVIYQLQQLRLP